MYTGPEYSHHSQIVTGQLSTEAIEHIFGVTRDDFAGKTVLDLGSGFRQQLAQDWEDAGARVISVDPNQPYSDEYMIRQAVNRIQTDSMLLETMLGIPAIGGFASEELGDEFLASVRKHYRDQGVRLESKDGQKRTAQIADYYRVQEGIPKEVYGSVVAATALDLPFQDGTFDLIIASSSVPYAVRYQDIPRMLAEANRVLKPKATARFNPVAVGDFSNFVDLPTIRSLVKTARTGARQVVREAQRADELSQYDVEELQKAQRLAGWLEKLGLAFYQNEEYVQDLNRAAGLSVHAQPHQAKVLVLTNKS